MDTPREMPILSSLTRPITIMGADRELVLCSVLMAVLLGICISGGIGLVIGGAFWVLSIRYLRIAAKIDPMLRDVAVRHIKYRSFYPAKSGLYSKRVPARGRWLTRMIA